ncbi:CMGC RCK [Hexamita inflata]|uniref:CMGC RCK n=1 Tax=Hexamita inflata TaxID=28002 RepID=A0AA86QWT5_9EUKA|nr:CMGC RCK [Hexamita inflata]
MTDNQVAQRQNKFRFVAKKGSGAFADVIQAENTKTGQMVAIKRMKQTYKSIDQIVQLREIQALKVLSQNQNTVKLLEILFDKSTGRLALVFELMSHDMYQTIRHRKTPLPVNQVKWYMFQILNGLKASHQAGFFHRDMKPENVLVQKNSESWTGDIVKLSDFGSARQIGSEFPYTEYISTRWYRPPEVLLSDGIYGQEMDIFGLGCVMYELIELHPIFPGKDEFDQMCRIHNVLGTPSAELIKRLRRNAKNNPIKAEFQVVKGCGVQTMMTNAKPEVVDIIAKMLEYDPLRRISAQQCLAHSYFDDFLTVIEEVRKDKKIDETFVKDMEDAWKQARNIPVQKTERTQPKEDTEEAAEKPKPKPKPKTKPTVTKTVNANSAPQIVHPPPENKTNVVQLGFSTTGALPTLKKTYYKAGK